MRHSMAGLAVAMAAMAGPTFTAEAQVSRDRFGRTEDGIKHPDGVVGIPFPEQGKGLLPPGFHGQGSLAVDDLSPEGNGLFGVLGRHGGSRREKEGGFRVRS